MGAGWICRQMQAAHVGKVMGEPCSEKRSPSRAHTALGNCTPTGKCLARGNTASSTA